MMQPASKSSVVLAVIVTASIIGCANPAVGIADRALDSHDTSAYNDYLRDAAKINLEREKAGLAPMKILTRSEWAGK